MRVLSEKIRTRCILVNILWYTYFTCFFVLYDTFSLGNKLHEENNMFVYHYLLLYFMIITKMKESIYSLVSKVQMFSWFYYQTPLQTDFIRNAVATRERQREREVS